MDKKVLFQIIAMLELALILGLIGVLNAFKSWIFYITLLIFLLLNVWSIYELKIKQLYSKQVRYFPNIDNEIINHDRNHLIFFYKFLFLDCQLFLIPIYVGFLMEVYFLFFLLMIIAFDMIYFLFDLEPIENKSDEKLDLTLPKELPILDTIAEIQPNTSEPSMGHFKTKFRDNKTK